MKWWSFAVAAPVRHLLVMVGLILIGVGLHQTLPDGNPAGSSLFFFIASILLAVGLYASTFSIPLLQGTELKVVVLAVTVGVVLKAALIGSVLFAVFGNPAYILLGAVMAQIDPLSVAALRERSRLSERGRAVLAAWSSFDDPITSVMVVLAVAFVGQWIPVLDPTARAVDLLGPASSALGNLGLLALGALVWWCLNAWLTRYGPDGQERAVFTAIAFVGLLALAAVAVGWFFMLGLAAIGLFYRPAIDTGLARSTAAAFAVAAVLLGIVAGSGVELVPGLVLGVVTYLAQVPAAFVVARRLPCADRLRLAFAHQSGITAIILALLVEPVFPGTVAVVAPAIVVVNLLHLIANAAVERVLENCMQRSRRHEHQRTGVIGNPVQQNSNEVEAPSPLSPEL